MCSSGKADIASVLSKFVIAAIVVLLLRQECRGEGGHNHNL